MRQRTISSSSKIACKEFGDCVKLDDRYRIHDDVNNLYHRIVEECDKMDQCLLPHGRVRQVLAGGRAFAHAWMPCKKVRLNIMPIFTLLVLSGSKSILHALMTTDLY